MKLLASIETLESRIAPAAVTLSFNATSGKLTVSGTSADDIITIEDSTTTGVLDVIAGTGTDLTVVGGMSGLTSTSFSGVKSIAINLGDGINETDLAQNQGLTLAKDLSITGGSGIDSVYLGTSTSTQGATVLGAFTVKLAGGADGFSVSNTATSVTHSFGKTLIDFGPSGVGSNYINSSGSNVSLNFTDSLTILGGIHDDAITLGGKSLSVAKSLTLNLGGTPPLLTSPMGSNSSTSIDALTISVGGKLSLISGDTVGSYSPTIGSMSSTIKIGGGLYVKNAATGTGSHSFDLDGATIDVSGGFNFFGGKSTDTVNIGKTYSTKTLIAGNVSIIGGDGDNTTVIGRSASLLAITGSLSASGTAGADSLKIFASTGSIGGKVSASFGKGQSTVQLQSTTAPLNVASLNVLANDLGSASDSLAISGVHFSGAVSATFGAGISTVTIDDSRFGGALSLNTGAGADVINIEQAAGTAGASYFFGPTSIKLGEGFDTLLIGGGTSIKTGFFLNKLAIDAGSDGVTDSIQSSSSDAVAVTNLQSANTFIYNLIPSVLYTAA